MLPLLLFLWSLISQAVLSVSQYHHQLIHKHYTKLLCGVHPYRISHDSILPSCLAGGNRAHLINALRRVFVGINKINGKPSRNKKPSLSNAVITVCNAGITRKVVLLVYFKMKFFSSEKHSLSSAMKNLLLRFPFKQYFKIIVNPKFN